MLYTRQCIAYIRFIMCIQDYIPPPQGLCTRLFWATSLSQAPRCSHSSQFPDTQGYVLWRVCSLNLARWSTRSTICRRSDCTFQLNMQVGYLINSYSSWAFNFQIYTLRCHRFLFFFFFFLLFFFCCFSLFSLFLCFFFLNFYYFLIWFTVKYDRPDTLSPTD